MSPHPVMPVTASASGPVTSSRKLVSISSLRCGSGWRWRTSLVRYSPMLPGSSASSDTKSAGYPVPAIRMADSRTPATHPSVRATNRSKSRAGRVTPWIASTSVISAGVIARSHARSSCICPASRYRCSGSTGSLRAARIRRSPGCQARIRLSRPSRTSEWLSRCASSTITTSRPGSGIRLNRVWTRSTPAPRAVAIGGPRSLPRASRSAQSSRRQNRRGSASAGVGVSQAIRAALRRTQSVSSTVLPAPGPAESKVSGRSAALSSSASRRVLEMCRGGSCGTSTRESRTAFGILGASPRPRKTRHVAPATVVATNTKSALPEIKVFAAITK